MEVAAGEAGEVKLSFLDLVFPLVSVDVLLCMSGSGVGGQAPGLYSDVGCEDNGPPPSVGGRDRRGLLCFLRRSRGGEEAVESGVAGVVVLCAGGRSMGCTEGT